MKRVDSHHVARLKRSCAALSAVAAAFALPGAAYGSPPPNDNFANAAAVSSVPFTESVSITEATTEVGEPIASPGNMGRTVWWSLTPTDDYVARIGPTFSPPNPGVPPTWCDLRSSRFLVVYRAGTPDGFGGLVQVAGDQWSSATVHTIPVDAGTTYYIQAGQTWDLSCGENSFGLTVSVIPAPPNDDFADATSIVSVPFSETPDLTAATVETAEPMPGPTFTKSAWYAFTPSTSGSYGGFGVAGVNVYTGASLNELTSVATSSWPGLYFWADANTTYYLQVYGGGVNVDVVPPPVADFQYSPGDPSSIDDVSLSYWNGGYWDPTVTGYSWDFGDGTTETGSPVSHKFANDGDYEVTITVEARGGRTNTATKTVQVRTHDVTILSLAAPKKGSVGKQGTITVGIGNTRYADTVQIDLYKITPTGDVLVGTRTQSVPMMRLKQVVTYSFNYVFTSEDATLVKVPFKAIATIQGARDAMSSDNTATSTATLVTK